MHPIVIRLLVRSLLWLAIVLLASAATFVAIVPSAFAATDVGSWNKPGENPFRGSRWHAVMSYKDMPLTHRVILGLRVQWSAPDMVMTITKNGVHAEGQTLTSEIIGMHFGKRGRYERIDRSEWSDDHVEKAALWCFEGSCIGSPYVCKNIFMITRQFNVETIRGDGEDRGLEFREEAAIVGEPASSLLMFIGAFAVCVWITARAALRCRRTGPNAKLTGPQGPERYTDER